MTRNAHTSPVNLRPPLRVVEVMTCTNFRRPLLCWRLPKAAVPTLCGSMEQLCQGRFLEAPPTSRPRPGSASLWGSGCLSCSPRYHPDPLPAVGLPECSAYRVPRPLRGTAAATAAPGPAALQPRLAIPAPASAKWAAAAATQGAAAGVPGSAAVRALNIAVGPSQGPGGAWRHGQGSPWGAGEGCGRP